jgi:hypothetical protein
VKQKRRLRLEEALARHRAAVEDFLASASRTPSVDWERGIADGKWSPAEITEHIRLSLEAVNRELDQGSGMRIVVSPWKRFLLRRAVLPGLLATGRFPKGVRAPREIHPSLPTVSKQELLHRLEAVAAELEARCLAHPRTQRLRLTHPFFGALPAADLVQILAWHALHHRAQLPGVAVVPAQ